MGVCKSPEFMVEFVVKSLQRSGERGIVLGGFAGLSLDLLKKVSDDEDLITYAEKYVLFIAKASHENLFPRMKCIVHHGGAGTTNAALRSGVPTIITPVFTDQFDHAYFVNKMGNGIGFSKQLQKITADELAKAIQSIVLQENGQKALLSMIEAHWNDIISKKEQ